jgi:hypothetical protein
MSDQPQDSIASSKSFLKLVAIPLALLTGLGVMRGYNEWQSPEQIRFQQQVAEAAASKLGYTDAKVERVGGVADCDGHSRREYGKLTHKFNSKHLGDAEAYVCQTPAGKASVIFKFPKKDQAWLDAF